MGNVQFTDRQEIKTDIDELVKADIENHCGTMRILDMSQPIGLDDIYTKVNILEKINGRRRKEISKHKKGADNYPP